MTIPHSLVTMSGYMLLSVLLGGTVGLERERHDRPAGLRTHILVCLGATLITLIDRSLPNTGGRIAAQIVTGVGFLGAGTIMRATTGGPVRGLTTAASLWVVAGVGMAIGFGGVYAETACVATAITLVTLTLLNYMEGSLDRRRRQEELTILFQPGESMWPDIRSTMNTFRELGMSITDLSVEKAADGELFRFRVHYPRGKDRKDVEAIIIADTSVVHYNWRS
jgi:putative Mg2+ transporter-C (MgtC) family protein